MLVIFLVFLGITYSVIVNNIRTREKILELCSPTTIGKERLKELCAIAQRMRPSCPPIDTTNEPWWFAILKYAHSRPKGEKRRRSLGLVYPSSGQRGQARAGTLALTMIPFAESLD